GGDSSVLDHSRFIGPVSRVRDTMTRKGGRNAREENEGQGETKDGQEEARIAPIASGLQTTQEDDEKEEVAAAALDRLVRNLDLLISWSEGELFVEDLRSGEVFSVSPETILLLDSFNAPRKPSAVADSLPDYDRRSVLRSIARFRRLGLLISAREGRRRL